MRAEINLPSELKNPFKSKNVEMITIILRNRELFPLFSDERDHKAYIDLVNGDTSGRQIIKDDNIASLFNRIQCFIDSLQQKAKPPMRVAKRIKKGGSHEI